MTKHILVTYATRAGSTAEVAREIARVLGMHDFVVDVKPIKEKPQLSSYQAVVLGSAIRMAAWLPEALEFIQNNQEPLARLTAAIFTVHMLNTGADKASRQARQAYTIPVRELMTPVDEVFFAGKLDYARLSFFDRLIARALEEQTGSYPADLRDWDGIHAWAAALPPALLSDPV